MDARDVLAARAVRAPVHKGSTSYFSAPDETLDPSLFRNGKLLSNVRTIVLGNLYGFWERRYRNPQAWSTVWVAGSGASYQWSAARAPGDLDVLIGVDYHGFRRSNPGYTGLSDNEISENMNDQFREDLDLKTARSNINGTVYEMTFYVNPGATDIRSIMPYAAYNVSTDEWTVHPDEHPMAPDNRDFKAKAKEDVKRAKDLLKKYEDARREVIKADTPEHKLNAESWLKYAVENAAQMFDEIHEGRHAAFREGGSGYADWANYRWQAGKANGIVPALQSLKALRNHALEQIQVELYGERIPDAEHELIKAALWRAGQ